jgi:hypothetical protein
MTSRVGRHYQPTLWDALKACACPLKLTLFASFLGIKISLNSKRGIRFWFGLTQGSFICPMPFDNPIYNYSWYNLLEVLSLYFTCTWCGTFYVALYPTKRKVMSSSRSTSFLCRSSVEFFYGFMSDSFTQDASIGWYPFHLIKYSRFRPLSFLDLSTASTSNSGSLWTESGGGLKLCSQLGLKASRETDFKGTHEMWDEL